MNPQLFNLIDKGSANYASLDTKYEMQREALLLDVSQLLSCLVIDRFGLHKGVLPPTQASTA